jgi:3-isopropylmalate/(R)-2-methylmalate dehydratase large subunit
MDSTIAVRILRKKCNNHSAGIGDIVFAGVDRAMSPNGTMLLAIEAFNRIGRSLYDPDMLVIVQDHGIPAKDIATANQSRSVRMFAREHHIKNYFEIGRGGICHHIVPDSGLFRPGDLIVGSDSHTCTYGAFGAFGTGVGSTDLAAVMATGRLWFRIPSSVKVVLKGKKAKYVQGKDIILRLISILGVEGATYKVLEFTGESLLCLGISDRITICNMAVEAGAKSAIFEVDDITREYFSRFKDAGACPFLKVGPDNAYGQILELDLSTLVALVAQPFLPSNVKPAAELDGIFIDQAFIGSCTNGRIEDMRMAAGILKGKKVHPDVRLIIIPGTQEITKAMLREGLSEILVEAGAMIGPPTCGPCLGEHMGVLGDGEVCISTTNRNFVGRMGSTSSRVYLANPAVVAASAVKGRICSPEVIG